MKKRKILIFVVLACFVSCASSQKKLEIAREKDPQYQYNVGLFYLNSNNVDEAMRYFNKALNLNPRYHFALNALGLAYSMKGNIQDAAKLYQKCLEIAPNFSEARNNLGTVYQELGYIDQAEVEFKKVIDDPEYPHKENPYYNLARLYFIRQDWQKALFYVDYAIKTGLRFHMGYNLRGMILENLERIPEAIDSYKQAIKIFPDELNYSFNLGAAYFKNNEFRQAGEIFEKIAPLVSDPEMRDKLNSYLKAIKEKEGIPY